MLSCIEIACRPPFLVAPTVIQQQIMRHTTRHSHAQLTHHSSVALFPPHYSNKRIVEHNQKWGRCHFIQISHNIFIEHDDAEAIWTALASIGKWIVQQSLFVERCNAVCMDHNNLCMRVKQNRSCHQITARTFNSRHFADLPLLCEKVLESVERERERAQNCSKFNVYSFGYALLDS